MNKIIIWLAALFSISLFHIINVLSFWDYSKTELIWEWNNIVIDNTDYTQEVESEIDLISEILDIYIDEEIKYIEENKISHIETPKNIKSLYFSAHSINNKTKLDAFYEIARTKEVNSITIDLKEVDWYTNFKLDDSYFWNIKPHSNNRIKNIEEILEKMHSESIYTIARISVFKDKRLTQVRPDLAIKWNTDWSVWTDYNWNSYIDPYSKEAWDYNASLAIAAYELWFDEVNFDYVRFPTDWYISKTYYPFAKEVISTNPKWWKIMVIDKFSNYITTKVREHDPNIVLSADVFWLVTNINLFQIWQNLESFLLSFDYVGPMIYPSHYSQWYLWFTYPDNHPYEIFKNSLDKAQLRIDKLNSEITNAWIEFRDIKLNDYLTYDNQNNKEEITLKKIRPWLQWFSCTWCKGYQPYNREKFRWQVNAVSDSWLNSWWVWSSGSNYYNERYDKEILITKKEEEY